MQRCNLLLPPFNINCIYIVVMKRERVLLKNIGYMNVTISRAYDAHLHVLWMSV